MSGKVGGRTARAWSVGGVLRDVPRPGGLAVPRSHRPMSEVLERKAAQAALARKDDAPIIEGGKFSFATPSRLADDKASGEEGKWCKLP